MEENKINPAHICPTCGCDNTRRSVRNGMIEKTLMRLFFVRPYRCLDCDKRFYGVVDAAFERRHPRRAA